jgi:hypothetical protein
MNPVMKRPSDEIHETLDRQKQCRQNTKAQKDKMPIKWI